MDEQTAVIHYAEELAKSMGFKTVIFYAVYCINCSSRKIDEQLLIDYHITRKFNYMTVTIYIDRDKDKYISTRVEYEYGKMLKAIRESLTTLKLLEAAR